MMLAFNAAASEHLTLPAHNHREDEPGLNAEYYAINISRAEFDDDRWFVGQTIRQMLNEKWTLLAEVFAFLPNTRTGGHTTWYFSGGPQ